MAGKNGGGESDGVNCLGGAEGGWRDMDMGWEE